jgi:hypothetical protein
VTTKKLGAKASKEQKPSDGKRPTGRPSTYSIELAAEICAWIASGKSLVSYCRQPSAPHLDTVYIWRAKQKEFAEMYAHAREDQADALADEMLDIADDSTLDPNDRRVRIDARKWIASKLKPRTYGDRIQTEVQGGLTLESLVLGSFRKPDEQAA